GGEGGLGRFAAGGLMVSAAYLAIMLYLVATFGDALDDHIGLWTWPLLLALLGAGAFARSRILAFGGTPASEETGPLVKTVGRALPASPASVVRPFAPAERAPSLVFRRPPGPHWLPPAPRPPRPPPPPPP